MRQNQVSATALLPIDHCLGWKPQEIGILPGGDPVDSAHDSPTATSDAPRSMAVDYL
jgi:hypothetical protein